MLLYMYSLIKKVGEFMQTLVIETQYRENYAAHDEGYQHGVSEPYWLSLIHI